VKCCTSVVQLTMAMMWRESWCICCDASFLER